MDKKSLVDQDILAGENLIRVLDEANLNVSSAFWYFLTDIEEWRLIIVTPLVDALGPRDVYQKIKSKLNNNPAIDIPLTAIAALSPSHDLNRLMLTAINTGSGISGIRFSGNVINGVLINDAYIYRVTMSV